MSEVFVMHYTVLTMCLSQVVRLIMKILLIEDDKLLGETLAEYLQIKRH